MAIDHPSLDDIVQHPADTDLNSEEGEVVHVSGYLLQAGRQSYRSSCFGKIFCDNLNGLKNILARVWHLNNLRITRVSRNIYVIFFTGEPSMLTPRSRPLQEIVEAFVTGPVVSSGPDSTPNISAADFDNIPAEEEF